MRGLLGNLVLALVWAGLTGNFTPANLALGFGLGLGVLWVAGDISGAGQYTRRVGATVVLAAVFLWQLALSNARVAHDVLTPRTRAEPAIVAVELDAEGDLEILLLTMLVTLTPGSVVLDISDDRRRMYVYGMYAGSPEAFRERLKRVFERRVLAVTR